MATKKKAWLARTLAEAHREYKKATREIAREHRALESVKEAIEQSGVEVPQNEADYGMVVSLLATSRKSLTAVIAERDGARTACGEARSEVDRLSKALRETCGERDAATKAVQERDMRIAELIARIGYLEGVKDLPKTEQNSVKDLHGNGLTAPTGARGGTPSHGTHG